MYEITGCNKNVTLLFSRHAVYYNCLLSKETAWNVQQLILYTARNQLFNLVLKYFMKILITIWKSMQGNSKYSVFCNNINSCLQLPERPNFSFIHPRPVSSPASRTTLGSTTQTKHTKLLHPLLWPCTSERGGIKESTDPFLLVPNERLN